ncbi:MAG TPA: helix-turn-helix transcriptional regulator [Pyrinomonadaceae bacterium]|jgi:transcriptional regulator with XRE-family HTH domain
MGRRARLRPKHLAAKLRAIRVALGLSQTELLKLLGFEEQIIYNRISEYELGKNEPPLPILLRYAEVAGLCVDVLINDKQDLPAKLPAKPKHSHR